MLKIKGWLSWIPTIGAISDFIECTMIGHDWVMLKNIDSEHYHKCRTCGKIKE